MISNEMFMMQAESDMSRAKREREERKKRKWQETIESRHIQADDIDAWE